MKLKDLEQEIYEMLQHSPDCGDAEFAQKYMPKLIKVAKAMEDLILKTQFLSSVNDPLSKTMTSWWNAVQSIQDLQKD